MAQDGTRRGAERRAAAAERTCSGRELAAVATARPAPFRGVGGACRGRGREGVSPLAECADAGRGAAIRERWGNGAGRGAGTSLPPDAAGAHGRAVMAGGGVGEARELAHCAVQTMRARERMKIAKQGT